MLSKKATNEGQTSMFFGLADTLNPRNELYKLTNKINWEVFEDSFKSKYSEKWSRPAKPIRLMCGFSRPPGPKTSTPTTHKQRNANGCQL